MIFEINTFKPMDRSSIIGPSRHVLTNYTLSIRLSYFCLESRQY